MPLIDLAQQVPSEPNYNPSCFDGVRMPSHGNSLRGTACVKNNGTMILAKKLDIGLVPGDVVVFLVKRRPHDNEDAVRWAATFHLKDEFGNFCFEDAMLDPAPNNQKCQKPENVLGTTRFSINEKRGVWKRNPYPLFPSYQSFSTHFVDNVKVFDVARSKHNGWKEEEERLEQLRRQSAVIAEQRRALQESDEPKPGQKLIVSIQERIHKFDTQICETLSQIPATVEENRDWFNRMLHKSKVLWLASFLSPDLISQLSRMDDEFIASVRKMYETPLDKLHILCQTLLQDLAALDLQKHYASAVQFASREVSATVVPWLRLAKPRACQLFGFLGGFFGFASGVMCSGLNKRIDKVWFGVIGAGLSGTFCYHQIGVALQDVIEALAEQEGEDEESDEEGMFEAMSQEKERSLHPLLLLPSLYLFHFVRSSNITTFASKWFHQ